MDETHVAEQAYNLGNETAKFPSDENVGKLIHLLQIVQNRTKNMEVRSNASLAITTLNKALKFKTFERRMKEFKRMDHYLYRVAFIER